ncbi:hypothetical protein PtB15_4B267 [Puccinia triticina]|nr:hypothetical protein PtB15_4B267 [Puccinia triticina]
MENSSFCPKTLRLARSFPEHTTRRPPHRLRTRSLDRQQPPKPIPRRKNSSVDHPAQPPGFHSHIPIEHTLLSVLPSARKASVDAGSPPTASGSRLSTASSAASPQSTLATSVHSAADPPRPRYQPRPLLLSAFGAKTRPPAPEAPALLDREAKAARRRARRADLHALSRPSPPAADEHASEDDDCWSWVSPSSIPPSSSSDDDDDEPAVVWRASLDVGRRVGKDRKARGRGCPRRPQGPKPPRKQPQQQLLAGSLARLRRRLLAAGPAALMFGSGLLGGLLCSLLSSTARARLLKNFPFYY